MKALQERLTALLDALDGYFELKETREKWLLILMPLLVSAFASYQFLVPSVTKQRTNDRQMIDELRLHIAEKESKLEVYRSLLQSKASSLETQRLMQTLAQAREQRAYIDAEISRQLSFLVYNQEQWARFLDSIPTRAKENRVHIVSLSNHFIEQNSTAVKSAPSNLSKVLAVGVRAEGRFGHLISFIGSIEHSPLLVQIDSLSMGDEANSTFDLRDGVTLEMNMTVWGVEL